MTNSCIKLIGIDVDGTLVGSGAEVHPRVWPAVQRARDCGIHLVLCSGRPAFAVTLEYARALDPDGWHIFQNGASIVQVRTNESRSISLPHERVSAVIAQARQSTWILELYADHTYVTESHSAWARQHAAILGVEFAPRPFESFEHPVVRAQWLISAADAAAVVANAPAGLEAASSTSPMMSETTFVGLTRAGVSKGSALRSLAGELGIDSSNVMYVGDAGNDLSALRFAGHPVAMANADRAVLDVAKLTVGNVDVGGVADALDAAVAGWASC